MTTSFQDQIADAIASCRPIADREAQLAADARASTVAEAAAAAVAERRDAWKTRALPLIERLAGEATALADPALVVTQFTAAPAVCEATFTISDAAMPDASAAIVFALQTDGMVRVAYRMSAALAVGRMTFHPWTPAHVRDVTQDDLAPFIVAAFQDLAAAKAQRAAGEVKS